MRTSTIVILIILAVLVAVFIILYILGRRLQKRQDEQNAQVQATKQPVTMLVIDKKHLRIRESGLPEEVISQTPWYARRSKLPIVRAKVGPQYVNLIADEKIFDLIPVKKSVKAMVSGIYIVEVRGARGQKLVSDKPGRKKGWWRRHMDSLQEKAGAKPLK